MGKTQRVTPVRISFPMICGAALLMTWIGVAQVSAAKPKPAASTADATDTPATDAPSDQPAAVAGERDAVGKAKAAPKKATPKPRPAPKRKRRKPKTLTPDPNAKWACDQTSVSAEPVWRNAGKSVEFEFKIRNEGTAPLRIRAKGG